MAKIEIHKMKKWGETWLVGIDPKTKANVFRAKTEKMVNIRARLYGYNKIEKKY